MKIIFSSQTDTQISAYDRAVQFGDAHFTTIKVVNGELCLWSLHLKRLQLASARLNYPSCDWLCITNAAKEQAGTLGSGVIKIIISRGESQRGYAPAADSPINVFFYQSPLPEKLIATLNQGVDLLIANTRLGLQPALAGLKHCNRLEQVLLKQELIDNDWLDAIALDINGNVIESSVANLFFYDGKTWFTPDLRYSGVDGVMRQAILSGFAKHKLECQVVEIKQSELDIFKAGFICNALIGICPINTLVGKDLSSMPVDELKALTLV